MDRENIKNRGCRILGNLCLPLALMCLGMASAQHTPRISVELDTLSLSIGEQLHYSITVETDSTTSVHFPEGQTFSPLETVEAIMGDTVRHNDRMTLQRTYALTQFDSGAYTIPPQLITIDEKQFFTDSFRIKVADVAVDTTQQKMYDIKPMIEVERASSEGWKTLLWILLALALAGALLYFLLRKRPLGAAEKEALLPPYDRALLELKRLENSKYLIEDRYKEYYSELTGIVRLYLEDEVHVSAMESTTDQLITKLEMLKDAGELNLEEGTLEQFQKILGAADLVKFAKSKPASSVAEQDRQLVEQLVEKTHRAKPEPSPEELLLSQEYLGALARKKRRKKIYWAAAILGGTVLLAGTLAVASFGLREVKDTLLGHPTKALLEGEWVHSSYGFPPIAMETPQVLLRQKLDLGQGVQETIQDIQAFGYGSYAGELSISSSSITFKGQKEPDYASAVEGSLASFGKKGMRNIITKQEEFVTRSGVKGLKTYGTGTFANPESGKTKNAKYTILSFGGAGFMQQLVLTWEEGDPYGEQIAQRIMDSLDVKLQV